MKSIELGERRPLEWPVGSLHPVYGEVSALASLRGEAYRFFVDSHGGVAMMPLSSLPEDEEAENGR